jgi:eukaryotic-like serine/threonine-protein kinase
MSGSLSLLRSGTLLAQRFEIERLAAAGGMGSVYRALDRHTGEPVAVKLLHEDQDLDPSRFEREARLLAELHHHGIVRYVAHGVSPEGERYLALEWLDGEDLSARLSREGLSLHETLLLARGAAEALGAAHRRGIVHRDIKPSNLFLVGGDVRRVKLLDFGVAHATRATTVMTRTGVALGTPAYMAPEQARGDRRVDASADVFALGCLLFECVTGRPAFSGDHVMAILAKVLFEDPKPLGELCPGTPLALEGLVARMMAKDPASRPTNGRAVLDELAVIEAEPEGARPHVTEQPPELTAGELHLLSLVLVSGRLEVDESISSAMTLALAESSRSGVTVPEIVDRFGGRLEILADGSLAVTMAGAGSATDQAMRAARCALAIRAERPRAPMALVTGLGAPGSPWPLGEVIDRAASLIDGARPFERADDASAVRPVCIDDVTAGLLDERFDVTAGTHGVELSGERETPDSVRTLLGGPTICVGREREIGRVLGEYRLAAEEGCARAVVITAAAGAGKSRIRYEFIRALNEGTEAVDAAAPAVWLGRADPLGAGSAFGLLAPAVRRFASIREGEPQLLAQQKLEARVAKHVSIEHARRVTEFLGELCGIPFADEASPKLRAARQDPTLMGDQIRRAWEDLLAAECAHHPVVLVLEDLHWGDQPTIRLVDGALKNLRELPFFVLALARPEVDDVFPDLWVDRSVTLMRLGPLSKRACEKLVTYVLGSSVERDVVTRITTLAQGNAFYLEELIRAAFEGRAAELPETVVAMVQARLEALDPGARRVLRAASVFGQSFWRGGVNELLGSSQRGATPTEWLPELCEMELVERRLASKFAGDVEYVFRSSLVREAIYGTLTRDDAELGHRLAGRWLERAGEADPLVLAEHFDRGRLHDRAVACWRRAAEHALEGHDFSAALARAKRGIARGTDGLGSRDDLGHLWLARAEAERWLGAFGDAEKSAVEAASLLSRSTGSWFRAAYEVMTASGRRGDYDVALVWCRDAMAVEVTGEARTAQIVSTCGAARQLFHAGRYDLADELIRQIEAMTDETECEPRALAEVHRLRGARARHGGDLAGDLAGYERAVAAFDAAGDARNAANARVSLAFSYIELGQHARAGEGLSLALAEAEQLGLTTVAIRARQNLGLVCAADRRFGEAKALFEDVIRACREQANARFEGWTRVYLARLLEEAGDAEGAEGEARAAAEILARTPPARAGALAALSRALRAQGRAEEAFAAAAEAMEVLSSFGSIEEFETLVRLSFAEAAHAAGRTEAAALALGEARDRLHQRARSIADAELRASFLASRDAARVLELAARWLPG